MRNPEDEAREIAKAIAENFDDAEVQEGVFTLIVQL